MIGSASGSELSQQGFESGRFSSLPSLSLSFSRPNVCCVHDMYRLPSPSLSLSLSLFLRLSVCPPEERRKRRKEREGQERTGKGRRGILCVMLCLVLPGVQPALAPYASMG